MKKEPFIIGIVLFLLWQPGLRLHAATADYRQAQAVHALRICLEDVGGSIDSHSQLRTAVIHFYEDWKNRRGTLCSGPQRHGKSPSWH